MLLLIAFAIALLALAAACWEIRNLRQERDAWRARYGRHVDGCIGHFADGCDCGFITRKDK